jgi:PAS domain S-box-containing protein
LRNATDRDRSRRASPGPGGVRFAAERSYFLFRHATGSNGIRDVEVYSYPVAVGEETYLYSIIFDVTDRLIAEEQLRVFVIDETGRYREVNPEACRITGYSEEELPAMSITDLIIPEHRELAGDHFWTILRDGRSAEEMAFATRTGEIRWWNVVATALRRPGLISASWESCFD